MSSVSVSPISQISVDELSARDQGKHLFDTFGLHFCAILRIENFEKKKKTKNTI